MDDIRRTAKEAEKLDHAAVVDLYDGVELAGSYEEANEILRNNAVKWLRSMDREVRQQTLANYVWVLSEFEDELIFLYK